MRAGRVAALACMALCGCDRVFGIGDPYQDAANADAATDAPIDAPSDRPSGYRKRITITEPTSTVLTNFPVSIALANDPDLVAHVLDGTDIGFVDGNDAALPCEIARYDAATGTLDAWVLVPELPASASVAIDLVYGVPRAPCLRTEVWPGHLGVWHGELDDQGTADSTNHAHDLTPVTATSLPATVAGIAGSALSFDGVDDALCDTVDDDGSLAVGTTSFSYSVWVSVSQRIAEFDAPFQKGGSSGLLGFGMYLGESTWDAWLNDSTTDAQLMTRFSLTPLDDWHYLAVVVDRAGGFVRTYVDGSLTEVGALGDLMSLTTTEPLCMGSTLYAYDGSVDEARIYSTALSREWIEATYANLAQRSQMIAVGPER